MTDANILIAGAGPTGLTLALELARRGFTPRIIDKGAGFTPVEQSRALGVNNRTLQLLGPSGVAGQLLASGHKVRQFVIKNAKGRRVIELDFEGAGALYPFMLVVPQGETERLLAAALQNYGIQVEGRKEVIAANGDAAHPSVDINSVDGIETVRADILIGADGAGSTVRKEFGFSFEGEGYPVEFGIADMDLEEPFNAEEATVQFTKNATLGWIPMGGRTVRIVSPRPDISKALPEGLKITQVIWQSTFHISFRHVGAMQHGAVYLAGDAAHVHSPAGARGMNLGIEDACWLAYAIDKKQTAQYSGWRLPEVRKVIEQTRQQTDVLIKMGPGARLFRDYFANSLLKFKPFKRAALKRITGLDTADPPWL